MPLLFMEGIIIGITVQFQTLYMEFLLSVGTVSPVMQHCAAAAEEQKSKCTHGSVEVFESLLPDPDSDNTLSQTELRHECGSNRGSFV